MNAKPITPDQLESLKEAVKGFVDEKYPWIQEWVQGEQEGEVSAHDASSVVWNTERTSQVLDCSDHDCGPQMARALVAMHNALPSLLASLSGAQCVDSEVILRLAAYHARRAKEYSRGLDSEQALYGPSDKCEISIWDLGVLLDATLKPACPHTQCQVEVLQASLDALQTKYDELLRECRIDHAHDFDGA